MSRFLRALFLPLLLPILPAGAAAGTLSLGLHARADIAPGITLELESVQDTRCPVKAQCIQKGKLVYQLRLRAPDGTESFHLSETEPQWQGHGLHITLQDKPTPALPVLHEAPPDYFIVLRVQP